MPEYNDPMYPSQPYVYPDSTYYYYPSNIASAPTELPLRTKIALKILNKMIDDDIDKILSSYGFYVNKAFQIADEFIKVANNVKS